MLKKLRSIQSVPMACTENLLNTTGENKKFVDHSRCFFFPLFHYYTWGGGPPHANYTPPLRLTIITGAPYYTILPVRLIEGLRGGAGG